MGQAITWDLEGMAFLWSMLTVDSGENFMAEGVSWAGG